ncbi:MAG: thrombospondin type 3 repeat-containing protein [Bacteroidota bacterium]
MITRKLTTAFAALFVISFFNVSFGQSRNDLDGDGIKNKRDKCPATPAGVKVDENGCPFDTDKDGIADYLDKCPDLPGSLEMNGCQDKDKDGVADNDDICPDVPGDSRFKGCPDSDADGIEDSKDKCPNAKGSDMFAGCPDTDGDGIEDAKDRCPDSEKGVKVDSNGCAADSDMDGIIDANDKCPGTQSGVKVDEKGCPSDTDGDGVIDSEDKCPTAVGDRNNGGCPVEKKETPKPRLQLTSRTLNYAANLATISDDKVPMLDEVVSILKAYPDYNLKISGFSDAIEKGSKDNTLSQSRAEAVSSYLVSKGIPENRISITAYGATMPVSTVKTTAARAKNRRVQLEFIQQK